MANLDPHRSASDLMLLRTPGKARLVTLQFVHVEGEIWVYCECLVCESTDARFFPTSAALEEHLNEPQYRDSFVKWPSIRCSQTSSATGALRLYHGVRAYADVAEHFFDKRRQGSYGPRAHDARVTHPPLCASTLPPYEIRVAMRNAWRRCFPVLADVRNCKEPSALWIVAELSSGVLLQEILVTGSQVGDHGFHCPCSPCVASVARHPTAEAICSHLASRMLAEPRGFSLGTLDPGLGCSPPWPETKPWTREWEGPRTMGLIRDSALQVSPRGSGLPALWPRSRVPEFELGCMPFFLAHRGGVPRKMIVCFCCDCVAKLLSWLALVPRTAPPPLHMFLEEDAEVESHHGQSWIGPEYLLRFPEWQSALNGSTLVWPDADSDWVR